MFLMYWVTATIGFAVFTAVATSTKKRDTSVSSPRITQLFPLTPVTAETFSSVKNVSLCVSLLTRVGKKAGRLNICSSSALKIPRAKLNTSALHSPRLAVKQTLLCLFLRNFTRKKATKYGAWATIFPGSAKVPTEDFTPSTPKTVSSALLPVQMKNPTPTLLPPQRKAQSSLMLHSTLITIRFGGKVLTRIPPQTQSNGKAIIGTDRKAKKRAHIPTAVSLLPQLTVLA